ncbi:hypothetical protein [Geoalkalibacter sp.]|uniref:hypothetical protein n=1 Tax=Geoalkalibacter sp. TaxID=3041440 RepID=UPI00272EE499|nr:hypothetical protein [Geoalkalibacter sp.]
MAIVECDICGGKYSDKAGECPLCKNNKKKIFSKYRDQRTKIVIAVMAVVSMFYFSSEVVKKYIFTSKKSEIKQKLISAQKDILVEKNNQKTYFFRKGETFEIKASYRFGCKNTSVYNQAKEYALNDDYKAFANFLEKNIRRKECIFFTESSFAYITDTSFLSSLVKIREKGTLEEYWTSYGSLK